MHNIKRLDEVWNDSISSEYIDKFNNIHDIIKDIISYLDNLEKCWQNYNSQEK